ncbi:hypothetical protein GTP56_02270 [Duganella sp. FT134W]|uniref:Reverse transcriptase domain-containing protein n=1 Tax=Duganella margarita TaxID=2692170 RepID=A0A7X4KF07_9BURK|nr:antiviral reverse transcriptase Drt3a [Duganella margarita]MYM71019.1 hypothetical protein [Duganella margarita]
MIEYAFTRRNLTSTILYKDIASNIDLEDKKNRKILGEKAMSKIADDTIFSSPLKSMLVAGKAAYRFEQLESELVSRLISKNIRANYRIRPENRHSIINNTLTFLKEGSPYHLYRFDVQNFFEEICTKDIINKLLSDGKCPRHTIVLLNNFFRSLNAQTIAGLPRGIGLSSTLAEFVLLEFDSFFKTRAEIFYFARFVDDILIITSPNQSASSLNSLVDQKLAPLKAHKVGSKSAAIHIGKISHESETQECFDYLGYKFKVYGKPSSTDKVMGIMRRKIDVEISPKKILKIKNRIIDSFIEYIKKPPDKKSYDLLTNRIKTLTGNYYITDATTGIPIKTGIFFNYAAKNFFESCSLSNLDAFLRGLLYSKRHKLSLRITSQLTPAQVNQLIGFTFSRGFHERVFHSFTHPQLREIKEGWKR